MWTFAEVSFKDVVIHLRKIIYFEKLARGKFGWCWVSFLRQDSGR